MQKIKIFIDFDGTILNTSLFKDKLFEAFFRMGYEMKDIKTTYMLERMGYKYNADNHLNRLTKIKPTSLKLAESRLENVYSAVKSMIYEDVIPFLDSVPKETYQANILTQGDKEYQFKKIDNAGLSKMIDNVYVTDQQKTIFLSRIISKGEKFIFIEDLAETLKEVKMQFPKSLCLQIIRQELDISDADTRFGDVYGGIKIKSLPEAFKYL